MSADALLDALLAAVQSGNSRAAAFLPTYTRWYMSTRLAPMPDIPADLFDPPSQRVRLVANASA